MKKFYFFCFYFICLNGFSQDKKPKDRYQFAHTYVGIESEILPQSGQFNSINQSGSFESQKLPSFSSTRFVIGGTHFWNHADFYVSIPIAEFAISGSKKAKISNGVLTGFRYFPIKISPNSIRPFAGVGFGGAILKTEGEQGVGPTDGNRQWYFEGGISYRHKGSKLFDIGLRYFNHKDYWYPNSKSSFERIELNKFNFMFSYKRLFDFSQNYSKKEMKKYVTNTYQALENHNALSTFSIGIGFSATIPLEKIELMETVPFLNQETTNNGNIDAGLAYYFHEWDAVTRISYRPLKQKETAYGYTSQLKTNAFAFEAFKFLGDYHGFVPFIGPYVGLNNYNYTETDFDSKTVDFTENKIAYGIAFGWDIRLSDIDWLILRTNLRYTPKLNYKKDGLNYTNQQLEFNFIQLVYYPKRHRITKKL